MFARPTAVITFMLILAAAGALESHAETELGKVDGLPFRVEGGAFVRHNGPFFNNRPLYCHHTSAMLMCGDRPFMRFLRDPYYYGNLMLGVIRNGKGKWLTDFDDVTSRYWTARMEWVVRDTDFPGLTITVAAVTHAEAVGFAARVTSVGEEPGDNLVWAYGGARQRLEGKSSWNVAWGTDPVVNREVLTWGFVPDECAGNTVRLEGDAVILSPPAYAPETNLPMHTVAGKCSETPNPGLGNGATHTNVAVFLESTAAELPLARGVAALDSNQPVYWSFLSAIGRDPAIPADPEQDFTAGMARVAALAERVVVGTPDAILNATVPAAAAAIDGAYYPPVYVHGAMAWNSRYPGWRTMYGGTAYGWHENVKAEVTFYTGHQIKESKYNVAKADPELGYGQQASDSRFYGRGRIAIDQSFYNMQTQFFDGAIHAWRWTGDRELEAILRPALELHAEWQKDCFDSDDDGVYESYLNTWPTDSQWYNGGGTAEETAYAARARQALMEMAERAGDSECATKHARELAKIRKGFIESLWVADRGFVGRCREQGGYRRLNEDAWLYSLFLPIDAGLLDPLQAVQALHYSDWALERVKTPGGGERVWTSNWVPSVWSVRELYAGDNHHLALAYCQSGMAEDGWNIYKGTFVMQTLQGPVPADLCGHASCGTDFNDSSSMFCRTTVEGLFGYVPDYPNGVVTFRPQFPFDWERATIRTPDFALDYRRTDDAISLDLQLYQEAAMAVQVPVRTSAVQAVTADGATAEFKLTPGFDCTVVNLELRTSRTATVKVMCADWLSVPEPIRLNASRGETVRLAFPNAQVVGLEDPQNTLDATVYGPDGIQAKVRGAEGEHLAFARVRTGDTDQIRTIELAVSEPAAEAYRAAKVVTAVPADAQWKLINIENRMNADVRTIFQQEYLSPRPETCSVRIGADGYSPWTFYYWGLRAPNPTLSAVPALLKGDLMTTPHGVPFAWNGEDRNIAFTSQWDNWPGRASFRVNKTGSAIWFLVCGSTNPMQTRIANAELRMRYEDGEIERLELVPPLNFWALCPFRGVDYRYERDAFCLPKTPPLTLQLGSNCRANLLGWRLRRGVVLDSVTLETLSQEVVIGLMGITIMQ